jgi:hypothetical protein
MLYIQTLLIRIRRRCAHRISVSLVVIALGLATAVLSATPVRPLDVAALTAGADLIVIGDVTTVVEVGPTTVNLGWGPISATQFRGSLRADQVLKGKLGTGSLSFRFAMPRDAVGFGGVRREQYGIFFLKATDREWEFFDNNYPALPAVPSAPLSTGVPLQDVTTVLGQVLSSTSLADSERLQALDSLGLLNTEFSKSILREALKGSSGDLRLNIARTLVAHDDVAGLEPIETALSRPSGLSQSTLANLSGSLSGLKDSRAVPALAKLAKSDNLEIRRNAATALRNTASSEALVPLSGLVFDPDPMVRYYAVVGLGEITRQSEWAPAFDEFKQHETQYLTHWRNWAEANLH